MPSAIGHYADVFELSDTLENATIDSIMGDFSDVNCLFTNPEKFIQGLLESIRHHNERLLVLFSDRIDVLAGKMEARLKKCYLTPPYTVEDDITLSFHIGGAAHVFMNPKYDINTSAKALAELLKNIPVGRF
jgi:hypothetical protein